jgi:DNA repair exonuclease SbcCD ATPase subunit
MMKRPLREALCGLLIGLLIMPAQPAQAQWATFDSAAFSQRAKSEIKRVKEWLDRIRHYQMLYTNAVEQLTTLGGVLERVDKELAKDKELARLTNDISDIIRGTRQLKNQIENQTRYQIEALQRIDSRVRNGLFDPEQDLQDLENYLLYSMGRNSKQTLRRAVNTAKADAILRVWLDERKNLTEQRAEAYEKLKDLKKLLDKKMEQLKKQKPPPLDATNTTEPLNQAIYQTEMLIGKLERDIAALEEKIQQRLNAHGLRLSDMENFAYQIESSKAAWLELQQTKQEIDKAFDAAVVEMNNTP